LEASAPLSIFTMSVWRVLLNDRLWDQAAYAERHAAFPEVRRLPQSKGRCAMRIVPKKDDLVLFVIKGHVIMKGFIEEDGFRVGTAHREHSCNLGSVRAHSPPNEFAWVHSISLSGRASTRGSRCKKLKGPSLSFPLYFLITKDGGFRDAPLHPLPDYRGTCGTLRNYVYSRIHYYTPFKYSHSHMPSSL